MRVAELVLRRDTFDVALAQRMLARARNVLERLDVDVVTLDDRDIDWVVAVQTTFTDAQAVRAAAASTDAPVLLWGFPEPRTGGRLRLNCLTGIGLAAHGLALLDHPYDYVYSTGGAALAERLASPPRGPSAAFEAPPPPRPDAAGQAEAAVDVLSGARIGVVGSAPEGFPTCEYDAEEIRDLVGTGIVPIELGEILRGVGKRRLLAASIEIRKTLVEVAQADELDAMAVRCWPEFFDRVSAAPCAAMAAISETGTPCACEADLLGALTSLALQPMAGHPPFLADLVHVDPIDDSAVFWHCGVAPPSLAHPGRPVSVGLHPNRQLPLVGQFGLRPGPVTVARLGRGPSGPRLVALAGEALDRPNAFAGTSVVVRFDLPAAELLDAIVLAGVEHHLIVAYGDHTEALAALAHRLDIPLFTTRLPV